MKKIASRGFTVVEIIVVIVVIAILASMSILAYSSLQADSRDKNKISDVMQLAKELDKYYDRSGNYPVSCDFGANSSCVQMAGRWVPPYGTIPPTIGKDTTLAGLMAILPGISENFAAKRNTTNPINQKAAATSNVSIDSYALLSLDAITGSTTMNLATNSSGSASITCSANPNTNNYLGASSGNRPHPYVIGYFSEVQSKWVFYHGPKSDSVNNLQWNASSDPNCTISTVTL